MMRRKFKANRPKVVGNTNIKPYWKVIEEIIDESDVVLEVLDARMVNLSRSEEIESLVKSKNKDLIFILNKADLANIKVIEKYKKLLKKEAYCYVVSSINRNSIRKLRDHLLKLSKNQEFMRIGVLGYPNTGKSSIINALVRRKKAPISSRAGTTHGQQWIKLSNNVRIIDSPGVIPLKQNDELRYALIGSRNPEKIKNLDLVAHEIIKLFKENNNLQKHYKIDIESNNPEQIIEEIGRKKGFIKKGNEIDEVRVTMKIIRDWQSGKLRL